MNAIEPTHLSVAAMSLNILHAHLKRNTPLLLTWLGTYSTSLLYHYTKWSLHPKARVEQRIFYVDMGAALTLYGISAHEIWCSHLSKPARQSILSFHVVYFGMFALSYPFGALMWSTNHVVAERWHAIFHWLTFLQTHLFLWVI